MTPFSAYIIDNYIITQSNTKAKMLYDKYRFGVIRGDQTVQLDILETLFLVEKKKIEVLDGRKKAMTFDQLVKRFKKITPELLTRYHVFQNLRDRGYIVKTALKFGAEFRVYEKGIKPGEDHAKWIVYPVREQQALTWYEFSAKNRVAHSTKKNLLIGVVDAENDVTYYEIKWIKP